MVFLHILCELVWLSGLLDVLDIPLSDEDSFGVWVTVWVFFAQSVWVVMFREGRGAECVEGLSSGWSYVWEVLA